MRTRRTEPLGVALPDALGGIRTTFNCTGAAPAAEPAQATIQSRVAKTTGGVAAPKNESISGLLGEQSGDRLLRLLTRRDREREILDEPLESVLKRTGVRLRLRTQLGFVIDRAGQRARLELPLLQVLLRIP